MALKQPGKNKGARLKEPPESAKQPVKEHLTISLRYLRSSHCIGECEQAEIASFVDKIRLLTTMSWLDISMAHRHGLGYETIARSALKVSVPNHITDDVSIIAFRFSGKSP